MNIRLPTIAALALLAAAPSVASRQTRSEQLIEEARAELVALHDVADDVREVRLRRQLESRIDHIDRLLARADHSLDDGLGLGVHEARAIIAAEAFDSDRLEAIRRVARQGRFTTAEARAMASMCDFDSTRADALIALYPSVSDPYRFELALDVLEFSSARDRVRRVLAL